MKGCCRAAPEVDYHIQPIEDEELGALLSVPQVGDDVASLLEQLARLQLPVRTLQRDALRTIIDIFATVERPIDQPPGPGVLPPASEGGPRKEAQAPNVNTLIRGEIATDKDVAVQDRLIQPQENVGCPAAALRNQLAVDDTTKQQQSTGIDETPMILQEGYTEDKQLPSREDLAAARQPQGCTHSRGDIIVERAEEEPGKPSKPLIRNLGAQRPNTDNEITIEEGDQSLNFRSQTNYQNQSDTEFDKMEHITAASGIETSMNNNQYGNPKVMSTQLQCDPKEDDMDYSYEKNTQHAEDSPHADQAFISESNYNYSNIAGDGAPYRNGAANSREDAPAVSGTTTPVALEMKPQCDEVADAKAAKQTSDRSAHSAGQHAESREIGDVPVVSKLTVMRKAAKPGVQTSSLSGDSRSAQNASQEACEQQPPQAGQLEPPKPGPQAGTGQLALSGAVATAAGDEGAVLKRICASSLANLEFTAQLLTTTASAADEAKFVIRRMGDSIIAVRGGEVVGEVDTKSEKITFNDSALCIGLPLKGSKQMIVKGRDPRDYNEKCFKILSMLHKQPTIRCHKVQVNRLFNQLIIHSNYPIKRINLEGLQVRVSSDYQELILVRNLDVLMILQVDSETGKNIVSEVRDVADTRMNE